MRVSQIGSDFPIDQIREARRTVNTVKRRMDPFNYGDGKVVEKNKVKVKVEPDDKATYKGEISWTGQKEGKGEMTWIDGQHYEGFWKNNKANGKGRLIYANREVYEGDFKDDQAHGYGTFVHESGVKYEGMWVNNMEDGKGKETYPNGDVFEGNFS